MAYLTFRKDYHFFGNSEVRSRDSSVGIVNRLRAGLQGFDSRKGQRIFLSSTVFRMSRDSSVGIATGYRLGDRMIGVRFPAGARNFSLRHRVQTGSGAQPASYPTVTRGSLPGV
jgi:hypothetical protein